eukprot:1907944-Pleurochrysis_carterae.AAC.1
MHHQARHAFAAARGVAHVPRVSLELCEDGGDGELGLRDWEQEAHRRRARVGCATAAAARR